MDRWKFWGWALFAISTGALALAGAAVVAGRLALRNGTLPSEAIVREALAEQVGLSFARRGNARGRVYVGINERDPDANTLALLRLAAAGIDFAPISALDQGDRVCDRYAGTKYTSLAANYICADYITTLLWRTILIRVITPACSKELILFKGVRGWSKISERGACS